MNVFLFLPLATQTTNKRPRKGKVVGEGLMILLAWMKDVLLKETASEVSKQAGPSRGAHRCEACTPDYRQAAAQTALSV